MKSKLNLIVCLATLMAGVCVSLASASGEQSEGLEQITKAMTEMDRVTQSNAASAEQSASVAHELSAQSSELGAAVSQLNIFTGASAQTAVRTPKLPVATERPVRTQTVRPLEVKAVGSPAGVDSFWR